MLQLWVFVPSWMVSIHPCALLIVWSSFENIVLLLWTERAADSITDSILLAALLAASAKCRVRTIWMCG